MQKSTTQPVTLRVGASRGLFPFQPGVTEVYGILQVNVAEFVASKKGKRCLLLDRSGSMNESDSIDGTRMESAKNAAILYVNGLNNGDIFTMITYNAIAEVIIPATVINETTRNTIISTIKTIEAGGDDVMSRGLQAALVELAKDSQGTDVTCYIMSDGESMGYNNPKYAWSQRYHKNPLSQTEEEAKCAELAQQMRQLGYSVIGVAFGDGCRQGFLTKITQNPERFIRSRKDALLVFAGEVAIATNVKLKDCGFSINLGAGVSVTRITQVFPELKVYDVELENQLTIPLGNVEKRLEIMVELQIEQPSNPGQLEVLNATFQYTGVESDSVSGSIRVGFQPVRVAGREIEWVHNIVSNALFLRRINQAEQDLKLMGKLTSPLLPEDLVQLRQVDPDLAELLENANNNRAIDQATLRQIATKTHSLSRRLDIE